MIKKDVDAGYTATEKKLVDYTVAGKAEETLKVTFEEEFENEEAKLIAFEAIKAVLGQPIVYKYADKVMTLTLEQASHICDEEPTEEQAALKAELEATCGGTVAKA